MDYKQIQEAVSRIRNNKTPIEGVLDQEVWAHKSDGGRLAHVFSNRGDASFLVGFTFGDLIYDCTRIDPDVISAVDFARSKDISNVFDFAVFASKLSDLGEASFEGSLQQIKGYVGERFVAHQLQASGMEVEFPESATNPGFDLLVNGQPFQVKCTSTPGLVTRHFQKYPDMPVFVNEEIADTFQDNPLVHPISGYREDSIHEITIKSLDSGAEVLNFELPTALFGIHLSRQTFAVVKGETSIKQGAYNASTSTFITWASGTAGKTILSIPLGLQGGFGMVVGGYFGAIGCALAGYKMCGFVKTKLFARSESAFLLAAVSSYCEAAYKFSIESDEIYSRKKSNIFANLLKKNARSSQVFNFFSQKFNDEEAHFYKNQDLLRKASKNPKVLIDKDKGIISAPFNAMATSVKAKVHPSRLKKQYTELLTCTESLAQKMVTLK